MRVERYFTSEEQDVFACVNYRTISIEICHDVAAHRLCIPHFEIPQNWSDDAARHLAHQFARRKGVPEKTATIVEEGVPDWLQRHVPIPDTAMGGETSIKQMVRRLVGAWTYWGWNQGYFDTESDARAFYDEHCFLILTQRAMPAAPQWQNTGLNWAYGLSARSSGNYYVDAESGELCESECSYERPQHHHYFIQGAHDAISGKGGIADLLQQEMRVFRHGSSSGCNLSQLRSSVETLSSGTPCAGVIPFLDIGDQAALALAREYDAKSRLSLIDDDHPDVQRLLRRRMASHREQIATSIAGAGQHLHYQWLQQAVANCPDPKADPYHPAQNTALRDAIKKLEARQVSPLLLQRYLSELRAGGSDIRGRSEFALSSESAGRAPHRLGLRLSDDFMRQSLMGGEWPLKSRTDQKTTSQLDASALLDEAAYFNWLTGDGLIAFRDNINRWNGCKAAGEIRATSPGGEFAFLDNTACDVAIINVYALLKDASGEMDLAALEQTVRLQTIMCDIAISMAQFPSPQIALNSYRLRPIGLSFCNLSALLMAMGYAYDSSEGRSIAAAISAIITGKGYATSAEIARELGSFESFSEMREGMMQLMWQHHEAAFGRTQHLGTAEICPPVIDHSLLPDDGELSETVQRVWDQAMISGDEFGYSNAQISLIGANPNAAKLMDALSAGIDPIWHFATSPACAQQALESGLTQLGYEGAQIESISAYVFGRRQMLHASEINSDTLLARGFGEAELELIEEALARGMDVHSAFDPLHLGERFCREVLHLSDAQLYDANFKLLYHLGYDEEAVEAFERSVCGHHSVEGAPFLSEEDYAVFALANPNMDGSNRISVEAQILMAASIQPYISGGIAQQIVTPNDCSIRQHRHYIQMAWQLGLKQIMLQRASAPQGQQRIDWVPEEQSEIQSSGQIATPAAEDNALRTPAAQHLPQGILPPPLAIHRSVIAGMVTLIKPARAQTPPASAPQNAPAKQPRALPTRRGGYVQEAHIGGMWVRHRTEEYEDGSLAVLTLELPDCERNLQHALRQHAAMLSIALQHGVPLDAFEVLASDATMYQPCGEVEGHREITLVQSITDYLLKDLLPRYAGEQSLSHRLSAAVSEAMNQTEMSSSPRFSAPRDCIDLSQASRPNAAPSPISIEVQFTPQDEPAA